MLVNVVRRDGLNRMHLITTCVVLRTWENVVTRMYIGTPSMLTTRSVVKLTLINVKLTLNLVNLKKSMTLRLILM